MEKLYKEEEIEFLRYYYPRKGRRFCAKALNRSYFSIMSKTRQLKLKLFPGIKEKLISATRIKGGIIKPFEQYKVNPEQFMFVKTKEAAYILGLLWADGCISDHGAQEIRLKCLKDDILEVEKIFLKTGDWVIKDVSTQPGRKPTRMIRTCNRPMAEFLIAHNYKPNTTFSAEPIIDLIPDNLKKYWFRGLIDGDGYWGINRYPHRNVFTLSGSFAQDWAYFERLLNTLHIKYTVCRRKEKQRKKNGKQHKHSVVRISNKKDVITLGAYIYEGFEDDNIGLKRKYDKYRLALT